MIEGVFGIRPEAKAKGAYGKNDLAPSGNERGFLLFFMVMKVIHAILRASGCRVGNELQLYGLHKF